jgi:hypothetical protein
VTDRPRTRDETGAGHQSTLVFTVSGVQTCMPDPSSGKKNITPSHISLGKSSGPSVVLFH